MPSNAPAMRRAGPITSTGSPRLQPGAIRARTPGTAALARNDCSPGSILPQLSNTFMANAGSQEHTQSTVEKLVAGESEQKAAPSDQRETGRGAAPLRGARHRRGAE